MKQKVVIEKIKSDYFLQNLFNHLEMDKSLKIVNYNKQMQKRLNLNINSYKDYFLHSPIVIEIVHGKLSLEPFINFIDNIDYYHIYLNDDKKEYKNNYLNNKENNNKIKVILDYKITSFEGLFANCKDLLSVDFKKFYRRNITNMRTMFCDCSSLKELNLTKLKTDNVTDMSRMFY